VSPGRLGTRAVAGLLCVLGVLVSAYLTLVEVTQGRLPLACPTVGVINCERVLTSPQSTFGPVPVPVLGIAWFVVLGALLIARGAGIVATLRSAWALAGLAFVLYFVYAELFLVGAICVWCTVTHLLVFALCLLVLGGTLP